MACHNRAIFITRRLPTSLLPTTSLLSQWKARVARPRPGGPSPWSSFGTAQLNCAQDTPHFGGDLIDLRDMDDDLERIRLLGAVLCMAYTAGQDSNGQRHAESR